jgi:hypothetical protein
MIRSFSLSFAVFFLISVVALGQEKVTLNGYVRDVSNGEELIGVTVYIPKMSAGTVTNPYGFYSLTLPKGTYEIQFSYVGYAVQTVTVDLQGDVERNVDMLSETTVMQEVTVTDKRVDENVVSLQMSKNTLDMNRVR